MLARMQLRGDTPSLCLNLSIGNDGLVTSRNVIADIPGSQYPEQVPLLNILIQFTKYFRNSILNTFLETN